MGRALKVTLYVMKKIFRTTGVYRVNNMFILGAILLFYCR